MYIRFISVMIKSYIGSIDLCGCWCSMEVVIVFVMKVLISYFYRYLLVGFIRMLILLDLLLKMGSFSVLIRIYKFIVYLLWIFFSIIGVSMMVIIWRVKGIVFIMNIGGMMVSIVMRVVNIVIRVRLVVWKLLCDDIGFFFMMR